MFYTSDVVDRVVLSSPCLNLDELLSSDNEAAGPVRLSDLSVTLLCGSDDDYTPVNSDQALSDVQIVDVSQVGRAWDSRWTVQSGVSGKRIPLPLCTSRVDQTSTHPPAVTPIPATSSATITSRDVDVSPGSLDPNPVPELGPVTVGGGGECASR